MQTYHRRSQNRESLRNSQVIQSQLNQNSQIQRSHSRKKYLEVCSKNNQSVSLGKQGNILSQSAVTLPIQFQHKKLNANTTGHLYRSQAHFQPIVRTENNASHFGGHVRTQSVPIKTIIIKQTVKPIYVNFSTNNLPQPNLRVLSKFNQQSLPIKQVRLQQKRNIIRVQQPRKASASIMMLSNPTFQNHFNKPNEQFNVRYSLPMKPLSTVINSQQIIGSRPKIANNGRPQRFYNQENSQKLKMTQQKITLKQQQISLLDSQAQTQYKLLSNQNYLNCEINLNDMAPKYQEYKTVKNSKTQVSIQTGQQNQIQNLKQSKIQSSFQQQSKQNMQTKSCYCICNKLLNFKQCSDIKINKGQVLKPKQNIIIA